MLYLVFLLQCDTVCCWNVPSATISSFILQNLIILNACLCLTWLSHRDKAAVIVLALQASEKGGRNFLSPIETGLSWRIIPPLLRLTSLCKFTDAECRDQVNTHLSYMVITSRVSLDRHFWSWSDLDLDLSSGLATAWRQNSARYMRPSNWKRCDR